MTEIIYMKSIDSCYERKFNSKVAKVDRDEKWVALEKTLFYPQGGGQPPDKGELIWNGGSAKVTNVKKRNRIIHYLEGEIPAIGTEVNGNLDWERRYSHMKMHTAQHLLSAVVWKNFKAQTVGNQIHNDRSHIDFHPASFTMDELKEIESEVNELISKGYEVFLKQIDRSIIEQKMGQDRVDLSRLPSSVKKLRIIFIGNDGEIDMCPCAGTHVKTISELGSMNITKRKSKGSGRIRVEYELN